MTGAASRRGVLQAIAAGALLPALARAGRAAAARGEPIAPPHTPMLFVRRLTRELSRGYAIVAERGFEVRFTTLADGFRIDGAQVSSSVDAPPNLAAYARLEQQRIETGLFPLELGRDGLIRSLPGVEAPATLERGVELALRQVETMHLSPDEKDQARAFLTGLEQAAGKLASAPPVDLFVPPAAAEQASRAVALPGGLSGEISSSFSGTVSPATGLLVEAERVVTTETAGTSRRTLEHWSLKPTAP